MLAILPLALFGRLYFLFVKHTSFKRRSTQGLSQSNTVLAFHRKRLCVHVCRVCVFVFGVVSTPEQLEEEFKALVAAQESGGAVRRACACAWSCVPMEPKPATA